MAIWQMRWASPAPILSTRLGAINARTVSVMTRIRGTNATNGHVIYFGGRAPPSAVHYLAYLAAQGSHGAGHERYVPGQVPRAKDVRVADAPPPGHAQDGLMNGSLNEKVGGGRCSRCGTLPEKLAGAGRLHLWPPLGHTTQKVHGHLRGGGWDCETGADRSVVVRLEEDSLTGLFEDLSSTLTGREMEDTRALFKPRAEGLSISDIPRTRSLKSLSAWGRSGWLLDMLSEDRLTVHFQPIVRVADPADVYAHECLMRGVGTDGSLVSPGTILAAARESEMLFQTDLAARLTAVREAARHGIGGNVFINFTPTAIYDPRFCLRATVEAVAEAGLDNGRVVFEITEAEDAEDVGHLKNIVDYYRGRGFRVAIDDVGSGYSSLNLLHQLRPDFVKLDIDLVRGVADDPYKAAVARKLLELARSLGVTTVAEGIETEDELQWVKAHGADYAQGYLIARPQSSPAAGRLDPSPVRLHG